MKITIVSGPFLPMPPAPCGAVERIWHGLAEEFVRRGHEVTVLCRFHTGQSYNEVVNGVHYIRRPSFRSGRRLAINLLKDFAYSIRMTGLLPPADVVVTNSFWLPALLQFSLRWGRIAVHVARVPKGQLFLYDRVDRLQAVSEAVRSTIAQQRPTLLPKVRVFPNPINTNIFKPPEMPRPTRSEPVVLYTGRLHPEKGIHLLIEATGRLFRAGRSLRLRVLGPWRVEQGGGGSTYLDQLKQAADGLPVEFHEPVFDHSRLAEYYRDADLYCYPSLAETGESFGVAPLEAMATGLAPIVSDLACFRDFLTNDKTGIVFDHRARDPAGELERALERLLDSPQLREELGTMASQRAAELSYPAVADRYLADFAELTGR
jgi:glycosyltransferase involved in cell wall biosynthesis